MSKKSTLFIAIFVLFIYPIAGITVAAIVIYQNPDFEPVKMWQFVTREDPVNEYGLTEFQMKHGVGPFTSEVKIPTQIDENLAKTGEAVFQVKCSGCHKLDKKYVGPPLRGVTMYRSPTYILNMILNPGEMVKRHPIAKGLLAQHYTVMSPQNVTEDDARAVLEFLRYDFEVQSAN